MRSEQTISIEPAKNKGPRVYDAIGNQIVLTNRNGKRWQFQFDPANRLTNTITPLNRQTKTVFNNRGLPQLITQPSGHTNSLLYDAKGRPTNRTDLVGTTTYKFDANNNLTNIAENGQTLQRQYDAYDRLTSYRDADGNLIQYRMDANGNVTNLFYPDGKIVKYFYDNLNRLTNVTDWANRKTSFTYDLANHLTSVTRPNGTKRIINYDAAGETTNIIEQTTTGGPIAFFKLNWNAAARVEWEFSGPLPHSYTPSTRTMTFDDDNRLATFNGSGVTIDLDGNLTYGPVTNSAFSSYTYDARNRLLAAGGVSYGYDPAGNRISITNGTNISHFAINPAAALSQVLVRTKNGVTNYYVYGLGLLYEVDDAGNTKTYHYDYRGSTIALTDGSGLVTDRIEYSIYGTTTYRGGTSDTPFLYNGRYGVMTDANGLLCMRARYYNPYLCRFINPDPAGFAGGLNWYAYADGNPVSLIDPFGLGGNPVSGPNGPVGPSDPFSAGGSFYVPIASPLPPAAYMLGGVVVGAATAAAVVFAAPVVVSGLVAVGVPAATASAAVTGTIGVAGAVGGGLTIGSTVNSALNSDWNAIAFNAGTLAGGGLVGIGGGGRFMANNMGAGPSSIPLGSNPFSAEAGMGFKLNYPGGTVWSWLAKAPTPASGGAAATGIASGTGLLVEPSGKPNK